MGNRGRSASVKNREEKKLKLHNALKEHTRAKALLELKSGADFNDRKYTQHRNYHVRELAWKLAGEMVPEDKAGREQLLDTLTKGCTLGKVEQFKDRFGLNEVETTEERFQAKVA